MMKALASAIENTNKLDMGSIENFDPEKNKLEKNKFEGINTESGYKPNAELIKNSSLEQLIEENKAKFMNLRELLMNEEDPIKTAEGETDDDSDGNEGADNGKENKDENAEDLSEEEINEKQRAAIKEAFERIKNGEKLTKEELGNLGEMMMDQYYISLGYKPLNKHRVTGLDDKKSGCRTGIDGVYEKTNPDGTKKYVIVDAKYNTSPLGDTNDGKQMSDNWIDKRLDDAVGKEKADEIREAAENNSDSIKKEIYHIDPNLDENGNIHTDVQEVDSEGNKTGDKTIVEYYDVEGNKVSDEK